MKLYSINCKKSLELFRLHNFVVFWIGYARICFIYCCTTKSTDKFYRYTYVQRQLNCTIYFFMVLSIWCDVQKKIYFLFCQHIVFILLWTVIWPEKNSIQYNFSIYEYTAYSYTQKQNITTSKSKPWVYVQYFIFLCLIICFEMMTTTIWSVCLH